MTGQRWWGWGVGILMCLSGHPAAWADAVTLTNGETLEGIITQETAQQIELQVAWQSTLAFDRRAVAAVTRASDWDNRRLQSQWRGEFDTAQRREHARLAAIAERKARAQREALAAAGAEAPTLPSTSGERTKMASRTMAHPAARASRAASPSFQLPQWLGRLWPANQATATDRQD